MSVNTPAIDMHTHMCGGNTAFLCWPCVIFYFAQLPSWITGATKSFCAVDLQGRLAFISLSGLRMALESYLAERFPYVAMADTGTADQASHVGGPPPNCFILQTSWMVALQSLYHQHQNVFWFQAQYSKLLICFLVFKVGLNGYASLQSNLCISVQCFPQDTARKFIWCGFPWHWCLDTVAPPLVRGDGLNSVLQSNRLVLSGPTQVLAHKKVWKLQHCQ